MIGDADIRAAIRAWMDGPGLPDDGQWHDLRAQLAVTRQVRTPRLWPWSGGASVGSIGTRRLLAVAMTLVATVLLALWMAAGQQSSPSPMTFAPGSIAFSRGGSVYVADADGGNAVALLAAQPEEEATAPIIRFAPDRRHLASMSAGETGSRLVIVSPDGSSVGSVFLPDTVGMPWNLEFSWAPDGDRLAIYTPDEPRRLAIVGLDGERLDMLAIPENAGPAEAYGAAMLPWSPDGRWIAVRACPTVQPCDAPRYLLLASDGTGSRPLVDPSLDDRAVQTSHQYLAWAPDGRAALNEWWPGRVDILSSDRTDVEEALLPEGMNPADAWGPLAWSPSGDRLAVAGSTADQDGSQFVVIDDDLQTHLVTTGSMGVEGFTWSADGQRLVFGSYRTEPPESLALWSVAEGGTATRLIDRVDEPSVSDARNFDVAWDTDRLHP